jgi:hypothetical protein
MYSQSDIEDAVEAGALSADQAERFRDHVAARSGVATSSQEYLRYVTGFNDLFILFACIFTLRTFGWIGNQVPPDVLGAQSAPAVPVTLPFGTSLPPFIWPIEPFSSPFAALLVAAAAWGLAEIFTRRRRAALASIMLAVAFPVSIFWALRLLAITLIGPGLGSQAVGAAVDLACVAVAVGLTWEHWKRFRVPVTIAFAVWLIVMAGILPLLGLISSAPAEEPLKIFVLLAGLGTFVFAMWWDGQDRARKTDKSDIAFWLHALAAMLIVLSLIGIFSLDQGPASTGAAIGMILIYALFGLVALAVDRKVILLVALIPLLASIGSLLTPAPSDDYFTSFGDAAARTLRAQMTGVAIVAAILLLLAIFWTPLRRAMVSVLPQWLAKRVPAADRPAAPGAPPAG